MQVHRHVQNSQSHLLDVVSGFEVFYVQVTSASTRVRVIDCLRSTEVVIEQRKRFHVVTSRSDR